MLETKILGACPQDCPDTCSMITTVQDGKAIEVRGNPDHPFTRGGLCVKVNDYQNRVYSPDRVLYPLRRVGPKGEGKFERISWDAAIAEIKSRWTDIIDQHGPAAILPYSYLGTQGLLNGLSVGDAFFNKLGATVSERTFCDSGAITAFFMTCGPTAAIDPESFVYSKYIILWAINPISTNLHHWPFIKEAQNRGATVVVIDPFETRTAKQADWHLRIRPGTDGALALGMINVIITEDLVDHDYVANHTVGYEELKQRAAAFPPEKVSAITGIAVEDIRKLARGFATSQPSVIRMGVAIERNANGGNAVRAMACLPALVGSWRHCGGGIMHMPIWAFPVKWDAISRPDLIPPGTPVLNQWRLGPALTGEMALPAPIRSLFVFNSNPMVVAPEQEKIERGLQREDLFTVVSEHFITDTARYADIVLPATTQLEQWDIMFSWGHLYLTLNQPAVAPLGEAVPNTELFRRLATAMEFDDPFFQRSDLQLIEDGLDWTSPVLEGIDMALLRVHGYARLKMGTPETYVPHREGNFPTPSGKCEFKSSMAAVGNMVLPLFRQGYAAAQSGEVLDPLPNYIDAPAAPANGADPATYPLTMISPKSHAFLNSSFANLPTQQRHAGSQKVTIHPGDAAARSVSTGDLVSVFNDHGAFEAVAEVSDAAMIGVVNAPMGYWPRASKSHRTVNAINSPAFADYGSAPTFSDTKVNFVKAVVAPPLGVSSLASAEG